MWEKIKARLVDDWSKMLRWWSVQWALIGAILVPLLNAAPQVFPPELAALFPPPVRSILTALWLLMFIVFRAWKQKHPNG